MPNTPTSTVYPPASEVMPQTTKLLKSSPRTAHGYTPFVTTRTNIAPASLTRSEEHTSELQSQSNLVCRLLLEKKKKKQQSVTTHIPIIILILFDILRSLQ